MPWKALVFAVGQRFGRLTVVGSAPHGSRGRQWECRCDCGASVVRTSSALNGGRNRSCGCLKREAATAQAIKLGHASRTHGQSWLANQTATYRTWINLKRRCEDPLAVQYPRYGACGVTVCEAWHNFETFFRDMGPRPAGRTIDRIDNTKGYEPGNCRWATTREQRVNQRRPRLFRDLDGNPLRFSDVAHHLAMSLFACRQYFHRAGIC